MSAPGGPLDCLFCRIIAGELSAEIVAENDVAIAIRDISPAAPSHVLVLPLVHLKDVSELDSEHAELLAGMIELGQLVAQQEGIAESGYRLVFNVGDDGGNTVSHLHLHVIGGRRLSWPPG